MRGSRLVHLIVLGAFLSSSVGCSKQTTVAVTSNPGDDYEQLDANERVRIQGFTTLDGEYVHWYGHVETLRPDSLRFTPEQRDPDKKPATFSRASNIEQGEAEAFTLPRNAIHSLTAVRTDYPRTILTIGLVASIMFVALFIGIGMSYGF